MRALDTRTRIRLELWLFALLVLACAALAGWLSTRYRIELDLTASGRHTLSQASRAILDAVEGPVQITAFASTDTALRKRVRTLVDRYRRYDADVTLAFVDPDAVPDVVRERGITRDGELLVRHAGRTEHVTRLTEQALTNALQRLARRDQRYVVFLAGHGERNPFGAANHDLGQWARQLEHRGLAVQTVNLAETGTVPDNTSVLVIASPRVAPLAGEVEILRAYVARGGNVLWLREPGEEHGLGALAEEIGVELVPGAVRDPGAGRFGIDESFVLITGYPQHPATDGFRYVTLFPQAAALAPASGDWERTALLVTGDEAWSETGPPHEGARYDEGEDFPGPLTIGFAMTRPRPGAAQGELQRVAVLGDGDFLANTYLGNSGNLDLGLRLVNWLAHDEHLIAVPARTAPDLTLELPEPFAIGMAIWFLLGCPLLLAGTGMLIVYRRRRA